MNSVDQSFLLDFIQDAARAVSRGDDLPTLAVELLPDGQVVQYEGGYASIEELDAQSEAFHSAHPDFDYDASDDEASMPAPGPKPVSAVASAAPPERKRKRKPSMAYAARLAKREGVQVAMAADGTVTMTPVKPLDIAPTDTATTGNEWDRLQ